MTAVVSQQRPRPQQSLPGAGWREIGLLFLVLVVTLHASTLGLARI